MSAPPVAVFYAGANGAVKSTMREQQQDTYPGMLHLDPDAIAREIRPQDPRSVDVLAAKETIRRFRAALVQCKNFSLETTLSGVTILHRIRETREAGYWIELHYVGLPDPECNVERVRERAERGLHSIDPDVVRRRYKDSLENLPKALPLVDIAFLYDNWARPLHPYVVYAEGAFSTLDAPLPKWIQTSMEMDASRSASA